MGDVKYKQVAISGIKHSDLYQLLAYTVAANLPAGLLVYAGGEGERVVHEVTNVGKRLMVVPLSLASTPSGILGQVEHLAATVRQLRAEFVMRAA